MQILLKTRVVKGPRKRKNESLGSFDLIINRVFLLFGLYIIREVTDIRPVCVVYSIVHDFCFQLYQKGDRLFS